MKTETYNNQIIEIINKIRNTGERKDAIKNIFNNYIKDTIRENPSKLSELKFPCGMDMATVFEKLETAPKLDDFMFMKFLKVQDVSKTFKDKITNQMVTSIIGHDYEFKCEICNARLCIYIE